MELALAVSSVQREAAQGLGRPYIRMAPPIGVFTNTFADKTLDSRYDGTFSTVYRGNWPKGGTLIQHFIMLMICRLLPAKPY